MTFDFLLIYALLLWALTLVLISSDYSLFKKGKELKQQTDLSKYQVLYYGKTTVILYSILSAFVILSFFLTEQDLALNLINAAIITMAICEIISAVFNHKLYFNDREIIYENEVYRLKSLKTAKKVKRFGRTHEIQTYDGKILNVNTRVAEIINSLIDEKKEEKNSRKKKN